MCSTKKIVEFCDLEDDYDVERSILYFWWCPYECCPLLTPMVPNGVIILPHNNSTTRPESGQCGAPATVFSSSAFLNRDTDKELPTNLIPFNVVATYQYPLLLSAAH